jgi:hypothetical protein
LYVVKGEGENFDVFFSCSREITGALCLHNKDNRPVRPVCG